MKVCLFGTYNQNYSRNTSIKDGLKELGIDVVEAHVNIPMERLELAEDFTPIKTSKRIIQKMLASIRLLLNYRRILPCDTILVLYPGHLDLPAAWLISKLSGKKLIFDTSISLYDTMIIDKKIAFQNTYVAKILKLVEKILLMLPDKVFVDTTLMKDFINKKFGINLKKIFVVPLGANDKIYKPSLKKNIKDDKTHIFFFGFYNPLQGAPYIIRAIHLLEKEKNLTFTMLGTGALKQEVVNYAKKYQLTNVKFIESVPEKKLVSHIQKANIMLGIFSKNYTAKRVIPNKVFAALACSKPLISARTPAMTPFFKHRKHIYYCKPADHKSLAKAIQTLSKDKTLQKKLAKNGYAEYKKYFTSKQIAKTLLAGINK